MALEREPLLISKPMYKHYSFDLWGTLIKSNSDYKNERAKYFHDHFNPNKLSLGEVQALIRDIEVMCDYSNELTGKNIHAFEMCSMVLYKLGYDKTHLSLRDIQSLYHQLDRLFEKYPPLTFSKETIRVLKALKEKGCTLSVLSNTAFIKGVSISRFLNYSEFAGLFDFQLYSDDIGISKPNNQLYAHMISCVHAVRKFNPVQHHEIMHVGDNMYADIAGAKKVGIASFQINSNNKTIKDLLS